MKSAAIYFIGFGTIAAIAIAIYMLKMVTGTIDINTLTSFLGVLLSVFSFAAGCYFAVLAVTAYGRIREIEKASELIEATIQQTERRGSAFEAFISEASLTFSEVISELAEQIPQVSQDVAAEYVARLHLAKHRLDFQTTDEIPKKIRLARDLINGGDISDLNVLRSFFRSLKDPDSPALLREIDVKLKQVHRGGGAVRGAGQKPASPKSAS